jgi:hypothetical protein
MSQGWVFVFVVPVVGSGFCGSFGGLRLTL